MKDYTLFMNSDKYNFVTGFEISNTRGKKYFIKYAKGSDMVIPQKKGMDTLSHINNIMAKQYELFGSNISKFKLYRKAWIGEIVASIGLGAAGEAALCTNGADIKFVTGLGVVSVGGLIAGALGVKRNNDKIKKKEKIQYRDEHFDVLVTYPEYNNSLRGVSSKSHFLNFKNKKNPENAFDYIYLDKYSKKDLETIVRNIHQERVLLGLEEAEYDIQKKAIKKAK